MPRSGSAKQRAVATLALLALAACGEQATNTEPTRHTRPAATASSSSAADSLPTQLQGTWLVDLSRDQVRADLRRAGFGKYADAFFEAEDLGERIVLAVTSTADTFQIAWLNQDRSWYVGWYGHAREDNGVLTVTDAEGGGRDSYAWSVSDDQLTLRFRQTSGTEAKGIPFEAYSRAYFTRPLTAVDCSPVDLYRCL